MKRRLDYEKIRSLRRAGYSVAAIAKIMKCSKNSVWRITGEKEEDFTDEELLQVYQGTYERLKRAVLRRSIFGPLDEWSLDTIRLLSMGIQNLRREILKRKLGGQILV